MKESGIVANELAYSSFAIGFATPMMRAAIERPVYSKFIRNDGIRNRGK